MENRVWRSVRTKCLEQRAKQEMRLVETPLRQRQSREGGKQGHVRAGEQEGEECWDRQARRRTGGGKTKTGEGVERQGREITS